MPSGFTPEYLCAICGSPTARKFEVHGYWVRQCTNCAHESAEAEPDLDHVKRVYGDCYFRGGGAGYPDYLAEAPLLREHGRYYGRLLTKFTKPGRVFDVGAAAGFVLQGLCDAGWTGCGMEPNERMAAFAREKLGLLVETGSFESFSPAERYDLVSMIQVVAHFIDVRKAFAVASETVAAGGLLLIESWNRGSWTARFFGKSWHEYSPPSVLRWFSREDLEHLAAQFGFQPIGSGRPPKRIQAAHAKALLEYKLRESALSGTVRAMLRVIPDSVSLPYPAEDLFWMLFRKAS